MKRGTTQTLIKMKTVDQHSIGFSLPLDDQEFEFHFTAWEQAEGDLARSNYFKMVLRKDLISVMKRCGGIPEANMEAYVNLIEERNRLERELTLVRSTKCCTIQ